MPADSIPNPETLHRKIQVSHVRCRQLGVISNSTCNLLQNRLKIEELVVKLLQHRAFLKIATAQFAKLD